MGRDHPRYNTSFLFTVHLGIPDTRLALYRLSPARATVIGNKARSIGANAPSYTVYSMKYAHGFFLLWGGYNIFLLLIHYIFTHILQGYCTTIVSLYYCHVPVKQPPWKTWVKFICYKPQQKKLHLEWRFMRSTRSSVWHIKWFLVFFRIVYADIYFREGKLCMRGGFKELVHWWF